MLTSLSQRPGFQRDGNDAFQGHTTNIILRGPLKNKSHIFAGGRPGFRKPDFKTRRVMTYDEFMRRNVQIEGNKVQLGPGSLTKILGVNIRDPYNRSKFIKKQMSIGQLLQSGRDGVIAGIAALTEQVRDNPQNRELLDQLIAFLGAALPPYALPPYASTGTSPTPRILASTSSSAPVPYNLFGTPSITSAGSFSPVPIAKLFSSSSGSTSAGSSSSMPIPYNLFGTPSNTSVSSSAPDPPGFFGSSSGSTKNTSIGSSSSVPIPKGSTSSSSWYSPSPVHMAPHIINETEPPNNDGYDYGMTTPLPDTDKNVIYKGVKTVAETVDMSNPYKIGLGRWVWDNEMNQLGSSNYVTLTTFLMTQAQQFIPPGLERLNFQFPAYDETGVPSSVNEIVEKIRSGNFFIDLWTRKINKVHPQRRTPTGDDKNDIYYVPDSWNIDGNPYTPIHDRGSQNNESENKSDDDDDDDEVALGLMTPQQGNESHLGDRPTPYTPATPAMFGSQAVEIDPMNNSNIQGSLDFGMNDNNNDDFMDEID